jgi:hypothetical protein
MMEEVYVWVVEKDGRRNGQWGPTATCAVDDTEAQMRLEECETFDPAGTEAWRLRKYIRAEE